MNIGYKRVSTVEQVTTRQLHDVQLDKVYEDKASGATKDRPNLNRCLDALREGDTLHVHSVDRLARSLSDALNIIEQVMQAGAKIVFHAERLEFSADKSNPYHTFILHQFASIAELERAISKKRQREGLDRIIETGTKTGKPIGKPPLDLALSKKAKLLKLQGDSVTDIALRLKISRPSVYKLLRCTDTSVQHAKHSTLDL